MVGIENLARWVGAAIGLVVLAGILWQGVWRGLRQPAGRMTGSAPIVLRRPFLAVLALLWTATCVILWRPIPFSPPGALRVICLVLGGGLYLSGLALYLWGARTMGSLYKPSSAFGVRLDVGHMLITHGPFAFVRHPLYLGLQAAAIGGLLVYRNWTFVFVAANFLGLFVRARREERALAAEFGREWGTYTRQVPAWIPRLRRKDPPEAGSPGPVR